MTSIYIPSILKCVSSFPTVSERNPSDVLRLQWLSRLTCLLVQLVQEISIDTQVYLVLDVLDHSLLLHRPKNIGLHDSTLFGDVLRTK